MNTALCLVLLSHVSKTLPLYLFSLFPVFGEVPSDPALQIRQPAVHPAGEALTLTPRTPWKDQNPDSWNQQFPLPPPSSRANTTSSEDQPHVVRHTQPHHESYP